MKTLPYPFNLAMSPGNFLRNQVKSHLITTSASIIDLEKSLRKISGIRIAVRPVVSGSDRIMFFFFDAAGKPVGKSIVKASDDTEMRKEIRMAIPVRVASVGVISFQKEFVLEELTVIPDHKI